MATIQLLSLVTICVFAISSKISERASCHKIDTTDHLYRWAIEVYFWQNGETDFEQFNLQYIAVSRLLIPPLETSQTLPNPHAHN